MYLICSRHNQYLGGGVMIVCQGNRCGGPYINLSFCSLKALEFAEPQNLEGSPPRPWEGQMQL